VAMRGPALRSWLGDFVPVSSPSSFAIGMDLSPPPWGGSFVAFVAVVTRLLSSLRSKMATSDRCYHCQRRSVVADVHHRVKHGMDSWR
jgi:hypothetical protein